MPSVLSVYDIETPVGVVRCEGNEQGIHVIRFVENVVRTTNEIPAQLLECAKQLGEYFGGSRTAFSDLRLCSVGTDFQQRVWDAAAEIGWGETATYADIASAIGQKDAVRAVGTALGRNPLCILVPCHRVITSSGSIGGYAGGSWRKEWLLGHERGETASD